MKHFKVHPTRRALADADEVFMWINKEEPEAALRWYDGLLEAFRSLEQFPLRWGLARESPFFKDEIRQLIYGRYRVLFTIKENTVLVLSVRHGARDSLTPEDIGGKR
jgi:plasmid stabilization system protein ParE